MSGILFVTLLFLLPIARAGEWSGYIAPEFRYFYHDPAPGADFQSTTSLAVSPEYFHRADNRRDQFVFHPFLRWDQHDDERSHADIRELLWHRIEDSWEFKAGIGKVFWGVTESQHLVDIINQTDRVENPDGEDKLGQPMINFTWIREFGSIDLFILPYFREQTFPGPSARLSPLPYVDTSQVQFESGDRRQHIDYAMRWFKTVGDFDIGLSYFDGTGRDPLLRPGTDGNGRPALIPYYELIRQAGLDLQAVRGDWLWKLEYIHRDATETYHAYTAGFEYTLVGIRDSVIDLGIVLEYLRDSRQDPARVAFQDDVFFGLRLNLNDVRSTEVLAGVLWDRDSGERLYSVEASRRLDAHWKLNLESRIFSRTRANTVFSSLDRDDYLQIELQYYF